MPARTRPDPALAGSMCKCAHCPIDRCTDTPHTGRMSNLDRYHEAVSCLDLETSRAVGDYLLGGIIDSIDAEDFERALAAALDLARVDAR